MELSTILKPAAVRMVHSLSSKKRLFHDLGDIAATVYGLPIEPHGRGAAGARSAWPDRRRPWHRPAACAACRACTTWSACSCVLEKPLDFDAVDRQPVDLVFALFAPASSGVEHLKALALVSRTLRDPQVCAKLRVER